MMVRSFTAKRVLAVVLTCSAFACALPAAAFGATITVNTTSDETAPDGHCSLREAITAANTNAAPNPGAGECAAGSATDMIELPGGRYVLSILGSGEDHDASGDLDISGPTIVTGAGADVTTIDASHIDRVIQVLMGASVTISGVTITDGLAPSGANGANQTGTTGSPAGGGSGRAGDAGGGIVNEGTLSIRDSIITRNSAGAGGAGGIGTGGVGASGQGGAQGALGIGGDGGVGGSAGGVFSSGIALTLTRTIVSGNAAGPGGAGGTGNGGEGGFAVTGAGGGGGIGRGGSGGRGGTGGGVGQGGGGTMTLEQSSISGNAAGAGGRGGVGTGGIGGGSGGAAGGGGGAGDGGLGGPGGDGGGIAAPTGAVTTTDDTISGNAAGDGGAAGDGLGEKGGADSGTNGQAGSGGRGVGGVAGGGGHGGGVDAATFSAVNDTITANASGSGAAGGNATGGPGGSILSSGTNGNGGDGSGGAGGRGGAGGAVELLTGGATLLHMTIASNTLGAGGRPGEGQPGAAGTGGTGGTAGGTTSGDVGSPGTAGAINALQAASLRNSIVAANAAPACSGTLIDGGHDISFADAFCPGATVDPQLDPLAGNGGPTQTQALGPGSPAIDAVPAGDGCAATDQRGVGRPQGGACDIGAYEHAPPGVVTGAATGLSAAGATLGGQLNPNAQVASFHFEYGPTAAYGSSTVPQIAVPGVAPAPVSGVASGLAPGTTYHYRLVASNPDGTTVGSDQTFTTNLGPAGAPGPPRFLSASLHPGVFAVQRAGRAGKRARHQPPVGTTFRYSLSESARVVFTIEQILPGRRAGRACVAQTKHNGKRRACTRLGKPHRFAVNAGAGPNSTKFSGRIGGTALAPGRYRVTLVATDAAGRRSAATRLSFRVVQG